MKIIKRKNLKVINGLCGEIQEVRGGENLDIAFIKVGREVTPHFHKKTEEIYVILKGEGMMRLGEEKQEVAKDDIIIIPQNTVHALEKTSDEPLELLALTSPRFDPEDEFKA